MMVLLASNEGRFGRQTRGLDVSKEDARTHVYGMPYDEWKAQYQEKASAEQVAAFEKVMADPDLTS